MSGRRPGRFVLKTTGFLPRRVGTIKVGHRPNGLALSRTRVYVSSPHAAEIIVIDRESEQVIGTIPLAAFPTSLSGGLVPTKP